MTRLVIGVFRDGHETFTISRHTNLVETSDLIDLVSHEAGIPVDAIESLLLVQPDLTCTTLDLW